jgi:hypothetical protein
MQGVRKVKSRGIIEPGTRTAYERDARYRNGPGTRGAVWIEKIPPLPGSPEIWFARNIWILAIIIGVGRVISYMSW